MSTIISKLLRAHQTFYLKYPELGARELHMLELIASFHLNGDSPLTVTEVMALGQVGSPATNHRCLDRLIGAHLIAAVSLDDDRRVKYLRLAPDGRRYVKKLETALLGAVA